MNDLNLGLQPRLVVVLVTHNGGPWLRQCLSSLARQTYSSFDVIVVDSGSETPAAAVVGRILPDAEFIWVERNLGFGTACNYALGSSTKTAGAEYFLFLHDDVELDPEAISLLVEAALKTGSGIVGGKALDWDHPAVLVEVGMSADQFCFPYSPLEEGEIDQGQYEGLRETLFVTNSCMLVSRGMAMRCGLWDGAYFAFGEDLDLCIRSRVVGFKVMVEPAARFRHARALTTGARQIQGIESPLVLKRRNQLRTIAKNFHMYRTLPLVILFILAGAFRMIFVAAFRRFDELPGYLRTLGAFLTSLPDVLRRRRAVQKRRTIPDRRIRRFMIRDSHLARVQLETLIGGLERGTLAFGARTLSQLSLKSLRESLSGWVRKPSSISVLTITVLLFVALRKTLFGQEIASGSLWPFPEAGSKLLGDYFSQWRDIRLGSESAAPPALPILWAVSVISFGKAVLAQKLLVVVSIVLGLIGISRLVKHSTSSLPGRVLAVALYALGPVVHLMVSSADLAALALYAGAPFILDIALRILGPGSEESPRAVTPNLPDLLVRDSARLALICLPIVALGPSNFVALVILFALMGLYRLVSSGGVDEVIGRFGYLMLSLGLSALGLLPWFLEGMRPSGAILSPLFSGRAGPLHSLWSNRNFEQMLLLNVDGRLGALVALGVACGALVLAGPRRREESRMLVIGWIGFATLGGLATKGVISPPVASAATWMVVPLVIVAALSGHVVAGAEEELPKHSFGWRQRVAIPAVGLMLAAGVLLGWAPSIPGWDRPASTFAGGTEEFSASISSFLASTAEEVGDFRVLWLGKRWVDPVRSGLRPMPGIDYFLTGPQGLDSLHIQQPPPAAGERRLDVALNALIGNRLHLAGHVFAPANIRFIIVDPKDLPSIAALRRQRDIVLEQQVGGVAIFRNLHWLPRAVLAPVNLTGTVTAGSPNEQALMLVEWSGGRRIPRRSQSSFSGELPRTRHSQILVGDNFNSAWRAWVGDRRLPHAQAFGWANRFELHPDARGEVTVAFSRRWLRFFWLAVQAVMLLGLVAVARSSGTGPAAK
jgi:GT2 family glycosyltransferase